MIYSRTDRKYQNGGIRLTFNYELGPEWKHSVILNRLDYTEAEQWCLDNLSEFGVRWYKLGIDPAAAVLNHIRPKTVWYFKDETDATLFALKWI